MGDKRYIKRVKNDLNEEHLEIQEIIAGNKDTYHQIIDRYKDKLFAVAYHMSATEEEAEKLIEHGFIMVYKNLLKYDDSLLFSDWLYEQFISILGEKKERAQQAKLPFHNPHYIEMEEAIHSLEYEAKFQFLLINLLSFTPDKLSVLIGTDKEQLEENYSHSFKHIRRSTLSNDLRQEAEDCPSVEELTIHFDGKSSHEKEPSMNDHLEFCPGCREVLQSLKQEKSILEKVLEYPKLDESFNDQVLGKLVPFVPEKPKQRTWKYQLSVLGLLGATFLFSVFIGPALKPLATLVSSYMEHGPIYNVWTEGTYAVTDKEITLEVTKVEIDSLYMAVYYEISREGVEPETFPFEDVDFYSYNPFQFVDEYGKQYPIEATVPEHVRVARRVADGEENERPYYLIKMPEELPDKFSLKLNFSKLQGQYGKWNLEIPIRYDKVVDTAVTVALNKEMNIAGKIDVELIDATYSKNGSRLRYNVNHTKEEEERLIELLKKHDQEYRIQEIIQGRHVGVHVTTEDEEFVLPNFFMSDMMNMEQNEQVETYYSHYYMDIQYHQLKGKLENPMDELYLKIMGVSYQEPAFFSMEVPLKETDTTPLEGTINSFKLLDYTITPVKDGSGKIYKYTLIINGESQESGMNGDIGWNLSDGSGNYIPTEGWYHHEDMQKEGAKKLLHVELIPNENLGEFPETLVIKADYIYTQYNDLEGQKFPLFNAEENNESESD